MSGYLLFVHFDVILLDYMFIVLNVFSIASSDTQYLIENLLTDLFSYFLLTKQ